MTAVDWMGRKNSTIYYDLVSTGQCDFPEFYGNMIWTAIFIKRSQQLWISRCVYELVNDKGIPTGELVVLLGILTTICVNPNTSFLLFRLKNQQVELMEFGKSLPKHPWIRKSNMIFDESSAFDAAMKFLQDGSFIYDKSRGFRRQEKATFMKEVDKWVSRARDLKYQGYNSEEAEAAALPASKVSVASKNARKEMGLLGVSTEEDGRSGRKKSSRIKKPVSNIYDISAKTAGALVSTKSKDPPKTTRKPNLADSRSKRSYSKRSTKLGKQPDDSELDAEEEEEYKEEAQILRNSSGRPKQRLNSRLSPPRMTTVPSHTPAPPSNSSAGRMDNETLLTQLLGSMSAMKASLEASQKQLEKNMSSRLRKLEETRQSSHQKPAEGVLLGGDDEFEPDNKRPVSKTITFNLNF